MVEHVVVCNGSEIRILVVIQIESETFLYLLFNEVVDYRIRLA